MRRKKQKTEREPTIALINIVFLMLVFFLVAGTVARPLDPSLNLVHTADLEGAAPADALVIDADGSMTVRGQAIAAPEEFLEVLGEEAMTLARLVPDRDLPAAKLVDIGRALRAAGAEKVMIVTERGLE
ncbi:ExbD/TolR family protein [Salipiger mangrovisoli]|uniref:Biopolymer transporter ExbD n=1 Tax=Salipiger mangrovisoli TaxID=2865933 RepID=A0ABR9X360_9RHOB|nr:biopolymer transporter ExbD [Salipiger mangrovisoli]MBE9637949.1 biopolymer transporter ExbD [Salipiger mangrovisoli]